jgi:succinate dehydrogenase / fumarate reductase flavoprotein subunit
MSSTRIAVHVNAPSAIVYRALSRRGRIERLLAPKGERSVDSFHCELGQIIWGHCGISRTAEGLPLAFEFVEPSRRSYT